MGRQGGTRRLTTARTLLVSGLRRTASSNLRFNVLLNITCRSVSAGVCTAVVTGGGNFTIPGQVYRGNIDLDNNGATFTFSTTAAAGIDLQAQWSAASTSNTITANAVSMSELQ